MENVRCQVVDIVFGRLLSIGAIFGQCRIAFLKDDSTRSSGRLIPEM